MPRLNVLLSKFPLLEFSPGWIGFKVAGLLHIKPDPRRLHGEHLSPARSSPLRCLPVDFRLLYVPGPRFPRLLHRFVSVRRVCDFV